MKNLKLTHPVWYLVDLPARDPRQLPAPEVLVVDVVGDLLEILEVGADKHVAKGDEVTVVHVLDLEGKDFFKREYLFPQKISGKVQKEVIFFQISYFRFTTAFVHSGRK